LSDSVEDEPEMICNDALTLLDKNIETTKNLCNQIQEVTEQKWQQ
jgi:hypothetical protein